MKKYLLAILATLPLASCGALGSFSMAVQESRDVQLRSDELQDRSDEIEEKMDLLEATIAVYGPIAESFGPEVQEAYDKLVTQTTQVRGVVEQGQELLSQATTLHERSIVQSTDPETGETDWMEYGLLMLAGGGGLANERRKTGQEKKKLHERLDGRKAHVYEVERKLNALAHKMELELAKRDSKTS